MSGHLTLVRDNFRQWCGTNQRWFQADAVMAGACQLCQDRIRQERKEIP